MVDVCSRADPSLHVYGSARTLLLRCVNDVTFNLPQSHVVLPFPQVFPALFPLSDLFPRPLPRPPDVHVFINLFLPPPAPSPPSLTRGGPTCGEASILPFTSTRLRLELCFLSTSAGEDFPQRTSHPSPLQIYPNSSAAAPPPSRPSAAVLGASQASFISAPCLFCSLFHMFTVVPNSFNPSETRKGNVSNQQTCFFNPTKTQ